MPGAAYEEIVKAELGSQADKEVARIEGHAPLAERLERHRTGRHIFERQLDNERWILVDEQRTGDGGTVILYTDISDMKRREEQLQYLAANSQPVTSRSKSVR